MKKSKNFEFLEHTGDAYIAAYGRDLAEAFENAALAMFETMTETADVEPKIEDIVEVEGHDKESLLHNWLEDLLLRFEIRGKLYSKFHVEKIEEERGGYRLRARIYGEEFEPRKHKQKVGIKAITYHRMEIRESQQGATAKFILDI